MINEGTCTVLLAKHLFHDSSGAPFLTIYPRTRLSPFRVVLSAVEAMQRWSLLIPQVEVVEVGRLFATDRSRKRSSIGRICR